MSGELGASNFVRLADRCDAEITYSYPSANGDETIHLSEIQKSFYKSITGSSRYIDYKELKDDKERAAFWLVLIIASTVPAFSGVKKDISTPDWIIGELNNELSILGSTHRFNWSGYSKFKFTNDDDRYTKLVNLALIYFFRESVDFGGIYDDSDFEKGFVDLLSYLMFKTRLWDVFDFDENRERFISDVAKKGNGEFAIEFLPLIKDYAETFKQNDERLHVVYNLCNAIESCSQGSSAINEIIFFENEDKLVIDGKLIPIKGHRKNALLLIASRRKKGCSFKDFHDKAFSGGYKNSSKDKFNNSIESNYRSRFFRELNSKNLKKFGYSWSDFIDQGSNNFKIKSHIKVSIV